MVSFEYIKSGMYFRGDKYYVYFLGEMIEMLEGADGIEIYCGCQEFKSS